MIGNLLHKIGQTAFGVVGPVHDALQGSVETPTLNSDSIEMLELQETPVMPGTVAQTIYYYVGGTLVVGILVGTILAKVLKPGRTVRRAKARKATRTRRRTRARTKARPKAPRQTAAQYRAMYRSNGRPNRRKGYAS